MSLFSRLTSKSRRSPIRVRVFGKTDLGRTRDLNEDCFLVADLTRGEASLHPEVREHTVGELGSLFVVADGMGGAAGGEVASTMGVETIFAHMNSAWRHDQPHSTDRFAFRLREAVEAANDAIHRHAVAHPELKGMGTTATAAGLFGDTLFVTQVGDSRAYLIRRGKAFQLTKDQSLMQRLVDAGELTEEEAARSDRRNIILQALGPDERIKVDLTRQQVRRGDALVICSDGLSGQVTKEEIASVVHRGDDLVKICSTLVDMANERGGPDNVTVVVAQFAGDGLRDPQGNEEIGHQIYPLSDEENTEPVPLYRGRNHPARAGREPWRLVAAGLVFLALGLLAVALVLSGILP